MFRACGKPTIFVYCKIAPPAMDGRRARKMTLGTERAIKTAEGSMERMMFSNFSVKSKSPRQPLTIGPKALSSTQFAKSIVLSRRPAHQVLCGWTCEEMAGFRLGLLIVAPAVVEWIKSIPADSGPKECEV